MPTQMGGALDPTRDLALQGTFSVAGTTTLSGATTVGGSLAIAGALSGITGSTIPFTASDVIATGATGSAAAALPSTYPAVVNANGTGVSGAGVAFPTGAAVAGALYVISNQMTGVLKIYAVGGTINGTTGTTAFSLTATGNKLVVATCTVAGAWNLAGNT